jgi:uncharacterized membrane protein (DUF485 family)
MADSFAPTASNPGERSSLNSRGHPPDEPGSDAIIGLARARQHVSFVLTALVVGAGILFAIATGFWPSQMRRELAPGLSWMMVSFFGLLVFIFALVGLYAYWAARFYDADWMLNRSAERKQ